MPLAQTPAIHGSGRRSWVLLVGVVRWTLVDGPAQAHGVSELKRQQKSQFLCRVFTQRSHQAGDLLDARSLSESDFSSNALTPPDKAWHKAPLRGLSRVQLIFSRSTKVSTTCPFEDKNIHNDRSAPGRRTQTPFVLALSSLWRLPKAPKEAPKAPKGAPGHLFLEDSQLQDLERLFCSRKAPQLERPSKAKGHLRLENRFKVSFHKMS